MEVVMKRIASALTVIAIASTALAKTYVDNTQTVTHDCAKDPDATVFGNSNTFAFTGNCTSIRVTGNGNTVAIASVRMLDVSGGDNKIAVNTSADIYVSGNHNHITYRKGISSPAPNVSNTGNGNKISAR
jgi:DUF3060 family protein